MVNTLVIGTGNQLMENDGIAWWILNELAKYKLPKNVQSVFIGTECWSLINRVEEFEKLIVIDSIDLQGEEGESYFIPATELDYKENPFSLHDISWLEVLRMRKKLANTYIFGIQTNTLNAGVALSPNLQAKINLYTEKLYNILLKNSERVEG